MPGATPLLHRLDPASYTTEDTQTLGPANCCNGIVSLIQSLPLFDNGDSSLTHLF
jgi:hypothetical protein